MPKQTIDTGTLALNGADGDTNRDAADKINANFTELYNANENFVRGAGVVQGGALVVFAGTTGNQVAAAAGGAPGTAAFRNATEFASAAQGVKADNAQAKLSPGEGILIDATDPLNPIISATAQVSPVQTVAGVEPFGGDVPKQALLDSLIPGGGPGQYLNGARSFSDFFASVRSSTLTGLSLASAAVVAAADTVLVALGKLQSQITLTGWGTQASGSSESDLNSIQVSKRFGINTAASTANIPWKLGSTTVPFAAGSNGIICVWSPGTHWQSLMFDRSSNAIAYRRMAAGVLQPDDYLVVYPTGKTFLDVSQGGTGANTASGARTGLGLGNVDNTSDANKPVSNATQTALNAKLGSDATAASATKLATARTINGVAFDGTANITLPASGATWGGIGGTLSAQADLQAALDAKGSIITKKWTGSTVAPTTGAPMTITHNLGIPAKIIRVVGTILTAGGGYSAGDVVDFGSCPVTLNGSLSFNYTFYNSGNNSLVAILGANGIALNNKTTGAVTSLTASQVSLVFEVMA